MKKEGEVVAVVVINQTVREEEYQNLKNRHLLVITEVIEIKKEVEAGIIHIEVVIVIMNIIIGLHQVDQEMIIIVKVEIDIEDKQVLLFEITIVLMKVY